MRMVSKTYTHTHSHANRRSQMYDNELAKRLPIVRESHPEKRKVVYDHEHEMAQDGPRWPEDGLKMELRCGQNGAKTATKWPQVGLSDVADLHTDGDCPQSSNLASRVSEVRFFVDLGSTFTVPQQYQNSPPL